MRIIGGIKGGLLLKAPKGLGVRPTPDLVRQAIFNSLGEIVLNAEVLELFAGTAALSLESLSRGAKFATCVEISPHHVKYIRENFRSAGFATDTFQIVTQDVYVYIKKLADEGIKFDLVFADPPFGAKTKGERSTSHSQMLLDNVFLPNLIKPDGIFILGNATRDLVEITPRWNVIKMLKHGDSTVRFLKIAK